MYYSTLYIYIYIYIFFLLWRCDPTRVMASSFLRFLDHIQRRTTVGRTPLDEWSACRRDLYLTTHNTHNSQTSMPPVGFEPTISAGERPQTYALDHAATGTGNLLYIIYRLYIFIIYKIYIIINILYTGCPGGEVPDVGRMFLKSKYTDIPQNTYIQSWTVTELMVREKCRLLAVPRTVPYSARERVLKRIFP